MIIETEFETARLRLAPLGAGDASALSEMTDHPAILDAIHFLERPFTVAAAERLLTLTGKDVFVGGRLRADGTLAVVVGVHLRDEGEIEIGYWVCPAMHGQGLAPEAAGAVVARLRASRPGGTIVAECRRGNEVSWRLLHKLGFAATGRSGTRPGRERLEVATRGSAYAVTGGGLGG